MKQTLAKSVAAIWAQKGQKGGVLRPKSPEITLTKEKEKKDLFGVNVYKYPSRYVVCKISFPDRKDHRIRWTMVKKRLTRCKRLPFVIGFTGSTCDSGWFEVDDSCFRVFAGTSVAKEWGDARKSCLQLGSDLAVVDSETERKIIGDHLTNISNKYPDGNINAFIGIRKFSTWHWLDGSSVSASIWHYGFPWFWARGECGSLEKGWWWSLDWKLSHWPCQWHSGFICETDQRKSFFTIN